MHTCEKVMFYGKKTHLTLNKHTSQSTIIKDVNISRIS